MTTPRTPSLWLKWLVFPFLKSHYAFHSGGPSYDGNLMLYHFSVYKEWRGVTYLVDEYFMNIYGERIKKLEITFEGVEEKSSPHFRTEVKGEFKE